ncbi:hypothetical protein [Flavobacterium orientale]|uniref:Hydrolase n=1 Tax=Flavobacterium orientale TaxID=1756020 RepID=A0A916Y2A9_9FLAO|nr:hypothetical protein [Flavobacterium orientale]GGD27488.1 hypothetical protein GCM10011343_17110 [Flavobacterium orientale]
MKKSLSLYLLIVSVLFTLFTYMYYSKQVKFEKERLETYKIKAKDSIFQLKTQVMEANYFSLEYNESAQNYLENYDVNKLIPIITESLLNYNDSKEGNEFTGQDKIGEQKFIINKIKVLNHRWIIAEYSDGTYWGEVLLQYFIEEDDSITFKILQTFIYPKN